MTTLNPYIDFGGRCREALAFYQQCFGGEIVTLMTYAQANIPVPAAVADNVIHAEFRAGDVHFMASDGRADMPAAVGSNIMLSLNFSDPAEQQRVFDALVAGGRVDHPLSDSFWGACFGMLTDRFGLHWMLNCPKG